MELVSSTMSSMSEKLIIKYTYNFTNKCNYDINSVFERHVLNPKRFFFCLNLDDRKLKKKKKYNGSIIDWTYHVSNDL